MAFNTAYCTTVHTRDVTHSVIIFLKFLSALIFSHMNSRQKYVQKFLVLTKGESRNASLKYATGPYIRSIFGEVGDRWDT